MANSAIGRMSRFPRSGTPWLPGSHGHRDSERGSDMECNDDLVIHPHADINVHPSAFEMISHNTRVFQRDRALVFSPMSWRGAAARSSGRKA